MIITNKILLLKHIVLYMTNFTLVMYFNNISITIIIIYTTIIITNYYYYLLLFYQ